MKAPKLKTVKIGLPVAAHQRIAPPPKVTDAVYLTPEYRRWRAEVIRRAGGRCEARDDAGMRCTKAAPIHRMFADHRVELRDGGAVHDVLNGQCLCGAHHTAKTARARAERTYR